MEVMEVNVNSGLNIILTAAMLVLLMAVPAAAAQITVDGNGSDWTGVAGLKCVNDSTGEIGTTEQSYFVNGYDIADFCVYYDQLNDTLYFKINVTGVPGDTDGDGNPNGTSNPNKTDNFEVGFGEEYAARMDLDGDSHIDCKLVYGNNNVAMRDYTTGSIIPGIASGSIGPPYNNDTVVEMSFSPAHNLTGFGVCDNFSAQGWAGTAYDKLGEDDTSVFSVNLAPVPIPVGEDVCLCTSTNFNGSGSYDPDGTIVSWDWDFGDGNTSSGETTDHHYAENGTYTVTLTVTDDYGFVCSNNTTVEVYENPAANFTATEVCFCTNTTFNDTTTGGTAPYMYAWDFDGDGTVDSTEQNPSHHYPYPGSHTVRLNITDAHGCSNETTKAVYVVHTPVAVAQVNRSNVATPGGWVLFNGTGSTCDTNTTQPNSLNYTWEIHGGIYHGATVEYYVTNTTTAFLTVTDEYNCTATDNVTVTYLHRPVPVINFTATGCLRVELNASESYDPDGNITAYEWDADNGNIDNGTGVTCTANFSEGGNHTIRLNVTDDSGLTNTTTKVIYVSCKPRAVAKANRSFVASPGDWVLFNGTDSTYDTNVTNSLNYTWLIHGTPYDDDGEGILYYVTNDTTAVLTVRDRYNCTDTNTSGATVLFMYRPVPAVINFTVIGCLEVELNASESYDPDGNITAYEWDLDNDSSYDDATGITCTYNFSEGGDHTVGLMVTDDSNLTNTTRKVIYVVRKPTAVARVNRSDVAAPGGWVLFDGSDSTCDPQSEPLNYTWNIQGYIYHNVTVPFNVSGTTTAVLNVTDKYDCTDTDNATVTVHPVGEPELVPVLTPAGMLALIAIVCAVGAGRLRKGRGLNCDEPKA